MAKTKATATVKKKTVKKPETVKSKTLTMKSVSVSIKKILTCKCNKVPGMPSVGALIAEFIGTFLLVASVFTVQGQPLFVAFAIIGIILIIAGVSKAHINPAVTIGAWVTRKICSVCAIAYIAAQALGASAAFIVLSTYLNGTKTASLYGAAPSLFNAATITTGKEWFILFAELIGVFIISLGIARAIKAGKLFYSISYGFAVLVALLIAGSLTSMLLVESNTSFVFLNPAIAFAADAVKWDMWTIMIYVITPIIGAIAGFAINDLLSADACNCEDLECKCNC
jgi:glycerol uptake facilitator-like aquaporin